MILVLLGTNPYPFTRLIQAVELYARESGKQLIVQSGNTPVQDGSLECHAFVDHARLVEWMAEAELVVCQGGYGSLMDCVANAVRTVAVPRRIKYGESMDDQEELVRALADEGLIVPVYDIADLPEAIHRAMHRQMKPAVPSKLPEHVAETIQRMIDGN